MSKIICASEKTIAVQGKVTDIKQLNNEALNKVAEIVMKKAEIIDYYLEGWNKSNRADKEIGIESCNSAIFILEMTLSEILDQFKN